ncbi:MAG: radical SAM protein [Candidatus Aminicenantes bacterium]|nr:radical SAM protein [Candidatus Aminicenantes bacterium]MDH5715045.1 radical SAM protein [Candidatus Aminicenantes bacterium]
MKISRRGFIKRTLGWGTIPLFIPSKLFKDVSRLQAGRWELKRADWKPGYLKLEEEGMLSRRVEELYAIFESCELCPRQCHANRLKGGKGFCQGTSQVMVSSAHAHFGEEQPLVGRKGSGTIFFTNCNLRCVFCQNYAISQLGEGRTISDQELAEVMLALQKRGCHNINLVTPTHYVPNIVSAARIAARMGLRLPLVYNTSGYEKLDTLKLLDGVIDIYMPDLKYMEGKYAGKYSSNAFDYPEYATRAILEMHRQVGVLKTDEKGIALRGLIIRHLIMPNNVSSTDKFVQWVAENLPHDTYVNIMGQYRPEFKAFDYPEISRRINTEEYRRSLAWAQQYGLTRLDR